jgi:hypothetical protein
MRKYPFLRSLLSPHPQWHQKTAAWVIAAIAAAGQARSFAIATKLAQWTGIRLDSAVNRFYRLLRNRRFDEVRFVAQWARHLAPGADRHLLLGVDWTEWHHGIRMLAAAVVTGKRAIPLWVQACSSVVRTRSQNSRENAFVRVLAEALRQAGVSATLLCDRGFRRVSWLKLLDQLRLGFVVRLMDDVQVQLEPGCKTALAQVPLARGRIVDLGRVPLRSDGAIEVRVVGYWARGAKEPWWLATNRSDAPSRILSLYDRRMTVEECFRDTKGRRFGVKLSWTQFRDPEALARFCLLLAVALYIWILAGVEGARRDPSLRLRCRRKGPRQSYVTIGIRITAATGSPFPLTLPICARALEPPALRPIAGSRRGESDQRSAPLSHRSIRGSSGFAAAQARITPASIAPRRSSTPKHRSCRRW